MQQVGRCPGCGSPTVPGQRFCGACGTQLSAACPYCGTPATPGFRFCPNCGATMGGGAQQQQPAWGQQQQPAWGQQQQPAWGQPATGTQPPSNRTLLLVLLAALLIGLGGIVYWQFGDQLASLFSTTSGSSTGADTTAPTFSNISATAGETSARIDWETNEPASSQVEYGTTSSYELGTTTMENDPFSGASMGVLTHSIVLSDLELDITYHYRIKSRDAAGNEGVSEDATFTTAATTE